MGSTHLGAMGVVYRFAIITGVALPAVLSLAGCPGEDDAEPPACTGALALRGTPFTGQSLGDKELALTFDDGPSSKTLELSAYLKSKGIRAVFFQNGHCFSAGNPCNVNGTAADPAVVEAQLVADGHLVANHTQNHKDLTTEFPSGAAGDKGIIAEVADTDAIIAPYVPFGHFLFRAPAGLFYPRPYDVLHASAMDKYVGPIRWDIGGQMLGASDSDPGSYAADWDCWQDTSGFGVKTTKQCGDRYLHQVAAVGKGIVLMHDADYGDVANHSLTSGKGNSLDMVKYVVPKLIADGYTFKRADEIPEIAAELPPIPDAGPDAGPDAADASPDGGTSQPSGTSSSGGTPDASDDPCP